MGISLDSPAFANSLTTNLVVTVLVLVMVFLMPWTDRRICKKLGLNLQGGVSANPHGDQLLRRRQLILYAVFGLYALAVAYIVFFSRSATREYVVHVALFEDLQNAIRIDFGFLEWLRILFREGWTSAMSHVRVVNTSGITQVYMNIMLFVPMGYLLPYVFRWFRVRVRYRPVLTCFVLAFLIENLQLISRRGFYDMDDLASNTIGGLLGQLLFVAVAYVVTTPNWRTELKSYRRWRKHARSRTLYPFTRHMILSRTTLLASTEEAVWDFYIMKLGFRLIRQLVPTDSPGTDMLLQMGKLQVEVRCANRPGALPPQTLTLSVPKLAPVVRRLRSNGIQVSGVEQDVYTGLRCVRFTGPDDVQILIMEK